MAAQRIPLNFFSMAFGLSGLAESWLTAADERLVPEAVGNALLILSAVVWLTTVVCYLRYVLSASGTFRADLRDSIASPFASLSVITPMLLADLGLASRALGAAQILVDVFLVATVLLGGWFTAEWIYGPLAVDRLHPGYFLPTVAGGLVASSSAADVGQRRLAEVMLGFGIVCWFILGSMILARLFFRPPLPPLLMPTLAIELAPPAVASVAYFAIYGNRLDALAAGLAGYGLLMVLVQIRFAPTYLRLKFAPSAWAHTFTWAAAVTATLHWIDVGRPTGHRVYSDLLLAAVSVLVAVIAARTLLALTRRELFPPGPAGTTTPGDQGPQPA